MLVNERMGSERRTLNYNPDLCTGCGLCSETCPVDAIDRAPLLPIARGLIKMNRVSFNKEKCVLCGLCASVCIFGAIDLQKDGKSIRGADEYPFWDFKLEIDDEKCFLCGNCADACPRNTLLTIRDLPERKSLVKGEINVSMEKCIYCGECAAMCPVSAIEISWRDPDSSNMAIADGIRVDEDKCLYCGICKRICPVGAIRMSCLTCMYKEELKATVEGAVITIDEKCAHCGWCMEICPANAITVKKPIRGTIGQADERCRGESCHACVDVCPCNAISIINGTARIDEKFCVFCGACSSVCPDGLLSIERSELRIRNLKSVAWEHIIKTALQK